MADEGYDDQDPDTAEHQGSGQAGETDAAGGAGGHYGETDASADGGHYGEDAAAASGEAGFHPLDAAAHAAYGAYDVAGVLGHEFGAIGDVITDDRAGVNHHMDAAEADVNDLVHHVRDAAGDLGL